MKGWVVNKSAELAENSLGPTANLVINDIDFLELLL